MWTGFDPINPTSAVLSGRALYRWQRLLRGHPYSLEQGNHQALIHRELSRYLKTTAHDGGNRKTSRRNYLALNLKELSSLPYRYFSLPSLGLHPASDCL
jgi:hypothetical protein